MSVNFHIFSTHDRLFSFQWQMIFILLSTIVYLSHMFMQTKLRKNLVSSARPVENIKHSGIYRFALILSLFMCFFFVTFDEKVTKIKEQLSLEYFWFLLRSQSWLYKDNSSVNIKNVSQKGDEGRGQWGSSLLIKLFSTKLPAFLISIPQFSWAFSHVRKSDFMDRERKQTERIGLKNFHVGFYYKS